MSNQDRGLRVKVIMVPSFSDIAGSGVVPIGEEDDDRIDCEFDICRRANRPYNSPLDVAHLLLGNKEVYDGEIAITDVNDPITAAAVAVLNGAKLSSQLTKALERHHLYGIDGVIDYPGAVYIRAYVGYIYPHLGRNDQVERAVSYWQNLSSLTGADLERYCFVQRSDRIADNPEVDEVMTIGQKTCMVTGYSIRPMIEAMVLCPVVVFCRPQGRQGPWDYIVASADDDGVTVVHDALDKLARAENWTCNLGKRSQLSPTENWQDYGREIGHITSPPMDMSFLRPQTVLRLVHSCWPEVE